VETISRLEPWWVTGLVDGEGTFTYSRTNNSVALYFGLKLTAADSEIVHRVADYFRVGRIYEVKARAPTGNGGATKSATYYRVQRHDELPIITEHFDTYPLQSKKRDAYKIWRAMVDIKREFRGRNREVLQELCLALSAAQPRNQSWR
jgi:hypothetical protein